MSFGIGPGSPAATSADLKFLVVQRADVSDPTVQADWSKKKLVWVPSDKEGFVVGSIKQERGEEAVVEIAETAKQVRYVWVFVFVTMCNCYVSWYFLKYFYCSRGDVFGR